MNAFHWREIRWPRTFAAAGAVSAAALALAGCSSSSSDSTPTPVATQSSPTIAPATNTPTAAPTATPSPTVTSTPSAADTLAKTAGYFVYVTRSGDTAITVANLFNGEPGSAKAGYPDQIMSVNNLSGTSFSAGMPIAIPVLPTPKHILPTAGISAALMAAGSGKPVLFEPGPTLLSAYGGKVALHRAEFDASLSGYRFEYWLTGAATLDANGAFNHDTAVTGPLMVVAAGTMAAPAGSNTVTFQQGGVTYSVTALAGATGGAESLHAGLVAVP